MVQGHSNSSEHHQVHATHFPTHSRPCSPPPTPNPQPPPTPPTPPLESSKLGKACGLQFLPSAMLKNLRGGPLPPRSICWAPPAAPAAPPPPGEAAARSAASAAAPAAPRRRRRPKDPSAGKNSRHSHGGFLWKFWSGGNGFLLLFFFWGGTRQRCFVRLRWETTIICAWALVFEVANRKNMRMGSWLGGGKPKEHAGEAKGTCTSTRVPTTALCPVEGWFKGNQRQDISCFWGRPRFWTHIGRNVGQQIKSHLETCGWGKWSPCKKGEGLTRSHSEWYAFFSNLSSLSGNLTNLSQVPCGLQISVSFFWGYIEIHGFPRQICFDFRFQFVPGFA